MSVKVVLGCELNEYFLQVSYAAEGQRPKGLHMPDGKSYLQYPLVIGREKAGPWLYGEDAYKLKTREGNIAEGLYSQLGRTVRIAGDNYTCDELLGLLIGQAVRTATQMIEHEQGDDADIRAMAVSVRPFPDDPGMMLEKCFSSLSIDRIYLQEHEESLFSYLIHQPEKLLGYVTGVFDLTGEDMVTYCMEMNPRTAPVVVSVKTDEDTGITKKKHYASITEHDRALDELDERLCEYVTDFTSGRIVTSIYLIGDGFSKDWYVKSRKVLCRNRKVYAGSNLFSKGAAFSAAQKVWPGTEKEDFLYLGKDMLKYNIGMQVVDCGVDAYLPLLDAGTNYHMAASETEILLERADEIRLLIQPVSGGAVREEVLSIDESEKREGRAFSYLMKLSMKDESTLSVVLTDQGFGQFYPPKNKDREFIINLDENQIK